MGNGGVTFIRKAKNESISIKNIYQIFLHTYALGTNNGHVQMGKSSGNRVSHIDQLIWRKSSFGEKIKQRSIFVVISD